MKKWAGGLGSKRVMKGRLWRQVTQMGELAIQEKHGVSLSKSYSWGSLHLTWVFPLLFRGANWAPGTPSHNSCSRSFNWGPEGKEQWGRGFVQIYWGVTAEFTSENSQYWAWGRIGTRIHENWRKQKKNGYNEKKQRAVKCPKGEKAGVPFHKDSLGRWRRQVWP